MDGFVWYYLIVLLIAAAAAYFCYRTAEGKGRSGVGYGILGFFLPLIGVIVVLVISDAKAPSET